MFTSQLSCGFFFITMVSSVHRKNSQQSRPDFSHMHFLIFVILLLLLGVYSQEPHPDQVPNFEQILRDQLRLYKVGSDYFQTGEGTYTFHIFYFYMIQYITSLFFKKKGITDSLKRSSCTQKILNE